MLNQQALDSLYSATYMEDYLDCMENLPDDIQRYISRMRDLDIQYSDYMQELETSMEELLTELDKKEPTDQRKRAVHREELQKKKWKAQESLMKAQDIGDEKLQLAQNVQDNVENKARQLELDKKNLGELTKLRPREYGREMESQDPVKDDRNIKRARRARHEVYVPSIMGPSTLEVTSFVDSNSHDTHPSTSTSKSAQVSQVVVEKQPSARSQAAAEKAAANTAAVKLEPVYENPKAGSSSQVEVEPTRTTGRGSERGGGSSTRAAAVEKVEPEAPSSSKAVERPAAASTNTATPKKQTQKAQTNEKKYKKRKTKQTRNHDTSPPEQIDPDEPTYCLCDQVSYGEMIGCDNDLCPIEWFHFSCVNLTHKPKGKWYCPKCRGEKPNIMKPKAIFLKELEKYNREKEGNA